MFIIWLPVYGEHKQVRDKWFDSHLTGVSEWKFYWLMETIAHYNGFPLKVKSKCKCTMLKKFIRSKTKSIVTILLPLWHWMSFENWKLCLNQSWFHLSFIGLWKKTKKTLQMATCQDDQVQVCLLSYNLLKDLLSLRQNVSNLCQSFFVFLTVYWDKIFKYLDGILFFNKITIQFLHLLCSQNSTR